MDRIEILRKYIDGILVNMTDVEERRHAYVHLYGVAQVCALLALKRKEDVELAIMAGMLHDICSYARMDREDHARKSALMAEVILTELKVADEEEIKLICQAIANHNQKERIDSPQDEVLKDADTFQFWLYNPLVEIPAPARKIRCDRVMAELGLSYGTGLKDR